PPRSLLSCAPLLLRAPFFCHAYAAHRALHSFPTRRSSDLRRRHVVAERQLVGGDQSDRATDAPQAVDGAMATGQDCDEALGHLSDRKSTRLNSSHVSISYAVFCLKKKILQ